MGLFAGILTSNVYTMVVIMAAVTIVITPLWLKQLDKKEKRKGNQETKKLNRILI